MYPQICNKKIWLVSLIVLLVIVACTSASASDAPEKAGFHFMQYYKQKNNMTGTGYYIMSDSEFNSPANGDVIIVGGNAVFSGDITGNIFVAYADVVFLDNARIHGDITFLASKITLSNGLTHVGEIKQAVKIFKFLLQQYEILDSVVYDDTQPYYIIFLSFGIIQMIIGLIALSFMKNFLAQGSVILMKQTKSVIVKGLALYFIVVALIIIFIWSVIGFPIALLLGFIYIIVVYMGQVSLAIAIGLIANIKFIKKNNVYLYFIAGTVFIELLKLLPYLNVVINFIVLPIICFGIIAAAFLNTYVLRIYFNMPFLQKTTKRNLSDNHIRDIVLKDIL